ncbi:hypothetical protein QN277_023498 [Acacia crassicarpa]|uniref:MPN domain-containing protein n=1 Tax=Acacia crassicarpa TaxID=499986 RepID=A0AAE1JH23_9FABA|nr:hypothetical protein QN277_023498 [Acacia crassicarpa]
MDNVAKAPESSSIPVKNVIVHPLVLLSVADHYHRNYGDSKSPIERVVGVLLGTSFQGTVEVSNSYGVPFEEDTKDPSLWFLNCDYAEKMFSLSKKVNATEHIVGWYSTGPKLRGIDMHIHRLFHKYVPNPVLVIVDVRTTEKSLPIKAFCDVEESKKNATEIGRNVFVHVPSEIIADETEEIGIEHLLREVKHTTISTLETEVSDKLSALKELHTLLKDKICWYLGMAVTGFLPSNREILWSVQDMLNYFPDPNDPELIKALAVKTNDMMMVLFLCSILRCVIALHNLINNKIMNQELEKA